MSQLKGEDTNYVETVSGHTSSNVKICFEWVLRNCPKQWGITASQDDKPLSKG